MNFFIENLKDVLIEKILVPALEAIARIGFWIFLPFLEFAEIKSKIKKRGKEIGRLLELIPLYLIFYFFCVLIKILKISGEFIDLKGGKK